MPRISYLDNNEHTFAFCLIFQGNNSPRDILHKYDKLKGITLSHASLHARLKHFREIGMIYRQGKRKNSKYFISWPGTIEFIFHEFLLSKKTAKLPLDFKDPKIITLLKTYFSRAFLEPDLPGIRILLREFVLGVGLAQSLDKFLNVKTNLESKKIEKSSKTFQLFLHSCGEYFIFSTAANILTAATLFKASEQQKASP